MFVNASPTSVSDGASLGFALDRVRPNPAIGGGLNVVFALPTDATARLELLDISGRRGFSRGLARLARAAHGEFRRGPKVPWPLLGAVNEGDRSMRVVVIE